MKLKKGMIRVATWEDNEFQDYPGLLGQHLGIIQAKGQGVDWNITHLATGYCVRSGYHFNTLKEARTMLEKLETAPGADWTFTDPTQVSKDTREVAKKVLKF